MQIEKQHPPLGKSSPMNESFLDTGDLQIGDLIRSRSVLEKKVGSLEKRVRAESRQRLESIRLGDVVIQPHDHLEGGIEVRTGHDLCDRRKANGFSSELFVPQR